MISSNRRAQRTFAGAAPKYGSSHYEPIEETKYKYRKVKWSKEWTPSKYTQMLYDNMFKKWKK